MSEQLTWCTKEAADRETLICSPSPKPTSVRVQIVYPILIRYLLPLTLRALRGRGVQQETADELGCEAVAERVPPLSTPSLFSAPSPSTLRRKRGKKLAEPRNAAVTSILMPFGQYKGLPLADILRDINYVGWLLAQDWFA